MRVKLLFITDTDLQGGKLTGAHRRFIELVLGAVEDGAEVTVIGYPCKHYSGSNLHFLGIKKRKKRVIPDHLAGMYVMLAALRQYCTQIDYDYAISFGPTISICYLLAGYHDIISLFREDLIGYRKAVGSSGAKLLYYLLQERIAVKASRKVIVQCKNDKESLIKRHYKQIKDVSDKIYIQTNNVNASWMSDAVLKRRPQYGPVRILFIGNFSNCLKGHSILLPAIARLLDEQYNITLFVAGDGKELPEYKKKYEPYKDIVFLGRIHNVSDYLSMCDFEVVPSVIDSCPNTVLEGLAAGVAVYGTNTGGIPDLLVEPRYLFEPDEESAYTFLKRIIETKAYSTDREDQIKRKEALTFDWPEEILKLITGVPKE